MLQSINPFCLFYILTFRTMTISARVVRVLQIATVIAIILMVFRLYPQGIQLRVEQVAGYEIVYALSL